MLSLLRSHFAAQPAFDASLDGVASFPEHVWLRPVPLERFVDLIQATCDAFPATPPYEGAFDSHVPHLGIGQADDDAPLELIRDSAKRELEPGLPVRFRVGEVTLFEEQADGTWAAGPRFRARLMDELRARRRARRPRRRPRQVAGTMLDLLARGVRGDRASRRPGARRVHGCTGLGRIRAVVSAAQPQRLLASGWQDAWRTFHRPVVVGGVWIGPPWEPQPIDLPAVVIDPGRAFGTGAHPTTQLCVDLLSGLERGSLLDVGCGSGVLAIAAARLGFAPVTAIDDDPVAVEVTVANAAANGVVLDARVADALHGAMPSVDVAAGERAARAGRGDPRAARRRVAVTSGYLAGELPAHPGWEHAASVGARRLGGRRLSAPDRLISGRA